MKYFDAHCHVQFDPYDVDRDAIFSSLRDAEIGGIIVGCDRDSSKKAVKLADGKEFFATVGLHPNDKPHEGYDDAFYRSLAADPKVVAIGECGLDYYRMQQGNADTEGSVLPKQMKGASSAYFRPDDPESEKERQKKAFAAQIKLAGELDKPLMIHARPSKGLMDAYEDTIAMLTEAQKEYGRKVRGNMHFFVGNVAVATKLLELGFTFSFTAVLTFTSDYDEVIRFLPLESILSETDSPYVAPAPNRGKRNDPLAVRDVVKAIARIRGEEEETVRIAMLENARRVFDLPS